MAIGTRNTAGGSTSSPRIGDQQLAAIASKCWKKQNQVIAVAVALAESGGDPASENHNTNGTIDRGLWQVNSIHGSSSVGGTNVIAQVDGACTVFHAAGGWAPWVTYKSGAYQQYIPRAEKAVKEWQKSGASENVESLLEPFGGAHSEGAFEGAVNAATSWTKELGKILAFIGSSSGWTRIGKVVLGAGLLVIALSELTKISPEVPSVRPPGPLGKVVK